MMMEEALRAQRGGRGAEAADRYRRVLEADPSNFDAIHMLALIEYEYGRYESAIELLKRAIELRPDLGMARHNLRLLESMPQIEDGVCREILPRLLTRIEPVGDLASFAASTSRVHIVLLDDFVPAERRMLKQLCAAVAPRSIAFWTHARAAEGRSAHTIALEAGRHPLGGLLVMFGTTPSQATWLDAAGPERILLAVARDAPCALIDRIDEAEQAGDPKPGVVCATASLAERLGLPIHAALAETS
jgi:tetratricopeptide (TPR) repeat protein